MPATQTNHLAGGETTQLIVVLHEEVRVPDVHTLFKMGSKKCLLFKSSSVFICLLE